MYRVGICVAALAAVAAADVGGCDEKEAIVEFQNDRFNALNPYVSTSVLTTWWLPPKHVENQQYCGYLYVSNNALDCTTPTCAAKTVTLDLDLDDPIGAAGVTEYCNFRQNQNNRAATKAMLKARKASYASSSDIFEGDDGNDGRFKTGKPAGLKMSKGMTGVQHLDVAIFEPIETSSVTVMPHDPTEMIVAVHVSYHENKKLKDIDHDAVEDMVKTQIFDLVYKHDYFGPRDEWSSKHVKHLGTRFQPAVKQEIGNAYVYWYSTNFDVAKSVSYDMLMPAVVTHDGAIDRETFLKDDGTASKAKCADVLDTTEGWYTQCVSHPLAPLDNGNIVLHEYVVNVAVDNNAENLLMHTGSCQKSCQTIVSPTVTIGGITGKANFLADKSKCRANGFSWEPAESACLDIRDAQDNDNNEPTTPRTVVDYPIVRGAQIEETKNPELTVWLEGALLPPACTFMNDVRGTNQTKNSPNECSVGCGGRHEPRVAQIVGGTTLLVGAYLLYHLVMRVLAFFQTVLQDKESDNTMTRPQHKVLMLVVVVVILHILIATGLQWSSNDDCVKYFASHGSLRDTLSGVAWYWPQAGFTTHAYTWPLVVSLLATVFVLVAAGIELINHKQSSKMVERVLEMFPAMMFCASVVFAASGTYGAMSNGRQEDADALAGYWRGEAFYIHERLLGHTDDGPINGNLRAAAWLMVTAFIVVSVASAIVVPLIYRKGEFGLAVMPRKLPAIAMVQTIVFAVSCYMCRVAVKAHDHVSDAWEHDDVSFAAVSAVRRYCASASFVEDTVSEAGTMAFVVMSILFTSVLGVAWAIMVWNYYFGNDVVGASAVRHARTASIFAVAVLTPMMLFVFAPQKLSVCATLAVPPMFAVLAPIAIAAGFYVMCTAMVEQISGKIEDSPEMSKTESIEMSTFGYFGASAGPL